MKKTENYFPHDFHSRDHLLGIRKDFGLQGVGFYWCFVEILHERGGVVKEADIEDIAYNLHADTEMANAIIRNYDKFQIKGGKITNRRVSENIKKREEISAKRREASETRWNGRKGSEDPLPPDSDEGEIPAMFLSEYNPDLPADIPTETSRDLAKQHYIALIRRKFDEYLETADVQALFGHNIYDYKDLFEAVIKEVKTKDYVVINRKNVHVWQFLQVICGHIKKNGSIANLEQSVQDVERRYLAGKVKNKTNYLIAALYNSALIDASDVTGQ